MKTNEYRENVREEKTMCDSSTALPANSSFLWSDRTKNLLFENMRSTLNENVDKIENACQVYDDVGPLNLINQVINLTRKYIYIIRNIRIDIYSIVHRSKISLNVYLDIHGKFFCTIYILAKYFSNSVLTIYRYYFPDLLLRF